MSERCFGKGWRFLSSECVKCARDGECRQKVRDQIDWDKGPKNIDLQMATIRRGIFCEAEQN